MTKLQWEPRPHSSERAGVLELATSDICRRGQILAALSVTEWSTDIAVGATPVVPWVWARGFVAAERPKEEPSQRPNCAGTFSSGLLGGLLIACVPRWRRKDATALPSYSSLACSWYRSQNAPCVRSLPRALKTVHVYPSRISSKFSKLMPGRQFLFLCERL
jgi:hypothetical protein